MSEPFVEGTAEIAFKYGKHAHPAWRSPDAPGLIVHHISEEWRISHEASGIAVMAFDTQEQAERGAIALAARLNWAASLRRLRGKLWLTAKGASDAVRASHGGRRPSPCAFAVEPFKRREGEPA